MQVERVQDLQSVGDFIQLPEQEWHLNTAGRALYRKACDLADAHMDEGPAPQFEVQYDIIDGQQSNTMAKLVRIR